MQDGVSYTCNIVTKPSDQAKQLFLQLVQKPSKSNLKKFKDSCDYSSPINFETDQEVFSAIKSIYTHGNTIATRSLLYAEENCANETSHELILSWLGNEILINQASSVIEAFYEEKKNQHLNEIAQRENREWRKLECKTDACRLQRSTYFENKLRAVKAAKISPNMEPVRKELLRSLQMVSDASKIAFIKLVSSPDANTLKEFKHACTKISPIDFIGDTDLHDAFSKLLSNGSAFSIRGLIHADANCADIANRKKILSWLGNEILIQHADHLIEAMSYEDQKHELYDIAEIENDHWRETKCLGDPCASDRREYFSRKRKALEQAKISSKNEPYRRQLLKYLISDQADY